MGGSKLNEEIEEADEMVEVRLNDVAVDDDEEIVEEEHPDVTEHYEVENWLSMRRRI